VKLRGVHSPAPYHVIRACPVIGCCCAQLKMGFSPKRRNTLCGLLPNITISSSLRARSSHSLDKTLVYTDNLARLRNNVQTGSLFECRCSIVHRREGGGIVQMGSHYLWQGCKVEIKYLSQVEVNDSIGNSAPKQPASAIRMT